MVADTRPKLRDFCRRLMHQCGSVINVKRLCENLLVEWPGLSDAEPEAVVSLYYSYLTFPFIHFASYYNSAVLFLRWKYLCQTALVQIGV